MVKTAEEQLSLNLKSGLVVFLDDPGLGLAGDECRRDMVFVITIYHASHANGDPWRLTDHHHASGEEDCLSSPEQNEATMQFYHRMVEARLSFCLAMGNYK